MSSFPYVKLESNKKLPLGVAVKIRQDDAPEDLFILILFLNR